MNTESQILQVPIEDIIPNRFQPRLNFDDSSLQELANSIKQHGIIQPLVLRKVGEKYEIIAGERRYKASMMAGLTAVPAIITAMDDKKSAEVAIVENIQRKDLTSIEEAKSYKSLLDKGYLTQEELAKKMGISQSAISNKLRLLSLTNEVQEALMDGKISERHARSLIQVTDPSEQINWLNKIINERLTVKDLENKLKGKEDAPIIKINPNMEDIINNATDIIDDKPVVADIIDITPKSQPMANKFFNPLEDESVNMLVSEPTTDSLEEIEMLDFGVPEVSNPGKELYQDAIDSVKDILIDIKNSGINVLCDETDSGSEHQFNITIKKD